MALQLFKVANISPKFDRIRSPLYVETAERARQWPRSPRLHKLCYAQQRCLTLLSPHKLNIRH